MQATIERPPAPAPDGIPDGLKHALIEIDRYQHWHLSCVRRDGNAVTLRLYGKWTQAKADKDIMSEADPEQQWHSPVKTERFLYSIGQCWQERCINIWNERTL